MTIDPKLLDGRPLTDYERETLTITSEECAEVAIECNKVAVKISKLLRFGVDNTNPVTREPNTVELCREIGDLTIMLQRMCSLKFFHQQAYREGVLRKQQQLAKYTLHEAD